ncbi:MAG: single-stranded-DNA-specific exonuclease RecJ, partial [Sphaerochaetaceae bacterium]|nr:single-stranded-DNA-specific exonuclease RecJ [Sphaerochaetaceae bacterium]
MKWKIRQAAFDDIKALQERFNLDIVSAKILAGRGINTPDAAKFYLENDISFLHNPFLFEDMELFCDRIIQAIEDNEKVRVFGDRDVDGITSTALLVSELRRLGLDVSYTVPMADDPYGVTTDNIKKAIADGVTLAITVDCGISCFDEIDYAQQHGLDVLVTDHHIAGETLPPASAIIDPKVEGCGYPYEYLAGVGVAAKCIWAIRFALTEYYKAPIILLHSYPGNGTVVIEAARLENLIVTDRITEDVVPGILPEANSRLLKFLSCGLPIYVFDKDLEMAQLRKAFPKADIYTAELKNQFEKVLPAVRNKSLFALSAVSRFALYTQVRSELDTLIGLFGAYVRSSKPLLYKEYQTIMDLVAIGTVSDLMPMTDENRILVKAGLKNLETSPRDSLRPFLSMQNLLGHRLSTTDIGWQISPLMNASGRLGRPDVAINMLLSTDQLKAMEYAQELSRLNKERQKLGEEAWTRLQPKAKKSYESFGTKLVLVNDKNIARGITGIIATRLLKCFKCPSMVITQTDDGRALGSIRSNDNFNCHDFLSRYSDLFEDFGGHVCAGGFSLEPSKVDELCVRISEDIDYMDCPDETRDEIMDIDALLRPEDFSSTIMKIVERFEPYGEQSKPLQFLIEGARVENIKIMQ